MNHPQQTPQQDAIDVQQLARAIRFALVAILLGLSYLSIRSSLSIDSFRRIFEDMLAPDRALPALTVFVLRARSLFVAVSILVPMATFATLFLRRAVASFYIIGVLGFITIAQFITLYYALSGPLTQIISAMSSGPTR